MPSLGKFRETPTGWAGKITTVTFNRACALQRNAKKAADSEQPDYHMMCGPAEIGAGWDKNPTDDGRRVISIRINAPIVGKFNALLVESNQSEDDESDVSGDKPDGEKPAVAELYFRG